MKRFENLFYKFACVFLVVINFVVMFSSNGIENNMTTSNLVTYLFVICSVVGISCFIAFVSTAEDDTMEKKDDKTITK